MIKWSILQEDITILNVYVPNNRASNYVRQKLIELKGEIDESTIIDGDFNTPLTKIDKSSRQKINKDTVKLNTINQLDVNDTYKLLHPTRAEYTFSSHGPFIKTNHIPGHKTHLNEFKEQKSHNICFQTTVELNQKLVTEGNRKIPKYAEIKQHSSN